MPDTVQIRRLKQTLINTRAALKREYNGRKEAEGLAKRLAFEIQDRERDHNRMRTQRDHLLERVNDLRNGNG